ncbi:MAG: hypothetical protein DRJ09_02065 [Bacteroidetes bacterium]|nr:MAG: hypothetical protein DRJ09_02065 [Bacteroidota bacterium]
MLVAATLLLEYLVPALKVTIHWPVILLVMYLLTLGILYLLVSSLKARMVKFVNTYLLVSFSKMMLYAVLLFVYAWLNPDDAVSFILTFLVYYLALLIYEVAVLVRLKEPEK